MKNLENEIKLIPEIQISDSHFDEIEGSDQLQISKTCPWFVSKADH